MTFEMLLGGLMILMMAAGIVVVMTSSHSSGSNARSGGVKSAIAAIKLWLENRRR